VSHQVAALVFPALGLVLIVLAPTVAARVAVVVYTAGCTAMYTTSALYHRRRWSVPARQRMRRLDHSMILVGIAATYTPIAAIGLHPAVARVLLGVVWALAGLGVIIRNAWLDAPRWLVASIYIAVGWTAVGVLPTLWSQLGAVTFSLLIVGGLLYSIGALVYSRQRPNPVPGVFGYHEVFHALVLAAGLAFYAAVLRVVVRAR
jgi:hemolysin III